MQLSGSRKRAIETLKVKLGHGGTLDPMATGVLIVGVGKGTKQLNKFLECTKTYECVVLFGAATDSYDAVGKVVGKRDYKHITKELVEKKLAQFRGKIQQKPSIFSALKVDGKAMYEYARAGGDIPEVAARPVEVHEMELVEWLEPGTHEFKFPEEEVDGEQKEGAERLMGVRAQDARGPKRKRSRSRSPELVTNEGSQVKKARTDSTPAMSGALPVEEYGEDIVPTQELTEDITEVAPAPVDAPSEPEPEPHAAGAHASSTTQQPTNAYPDPDTAAPEATTTVAGDTVRTDSPDPEPLEDVGNGEEPLLSNMPGAPSEAPQDPEPQDKKPEDQPPAARLRMTVSSGFYVRSLCHDLGLACDSFGLMSSLIRTRQGDYSLFLTPSPDQFPVFPYEDLEKGSEVWEPKVQKMLEEYMEREGWEAEEVPSDEVYEEVRKEKEAEKKDGDRERSWQGGRRSINGWRGKGKGGGGGKGRGGYKGRRD